VKEYNSVKVTTLVDNDVWKRGLTSSWGLSLYVKINREGEQHIILMDTSGSFDTLFNNTAKFLHEIGVKLFSHCHCTGLNAKIWIANVMRERYVENGSGQAFLIDYKL
jgi:metal-dependent hydrolase (beta-lactamase superfamily II)